MFFSHSSTDDTTNTTPKTGLKRKSLLLEVNDNEVMKSPTSATIIPRKKFLIDSSFDEDDSLLDLHRQGVNSRRLKFRASKMSRVGCR